MQEQWVLLTTESPSSLSIVLSYSLLLSAPTVIFCLVWLNTQQNYLRKEGFNWLAVQGHSPHDRNIPLWQPECEEAGHIVQVDQEEGILAQSGAGL